MKRLLPIIVLLCVTSPAWATWTRTNEKDNSSSASANTIAAPAFTSSLTNPSLIIVSCLGSNGLVTPGSAWPVPTDTATNTYEIARSEGTTLNQAFTMMTWYALNTHTTASNIVTCHFPSTSATFKGIVAGEWTGGSANDSPVELGWYAPNQTAGTAGANNMAPACPALTCSTVVNGDLIYAAFACHTGACSAGTSPNSWTSVSTAGGIGIVETFVQASAGSILPTAGNATSSDPYAANVIAFTPSSTAAQPLDNFRNDKCTAADGASLGQNWTLTHCQGETMDDVNVVAGGTTTMPLSVNPVVGDYLVVSITNHPNAGTTANLQVTDSLGNVASGMVTTTNPHTVTFSSGIPFATVGCNNAACVWVGKTVTLGVAGTCTVTAITSFTVLTCSQTIATNATPQTYTGPTPYCGETIQSGAWDIATCIAKVSTGGADTITATTAVTGHDDFGMTSIEVSNTNGIVGVDTGACPVAGCEAATQTSNSSTGVMTQSVTPSNGGELVIFNAGAATGSMFQTAGNTGIIVGTSSSGTNLTNAVNNYCGLAAATPYCSNLEQSVTQSESGTGALTMSITDLTHSDSGNVQSFALQAGSANGHCASCDLSELLWPWMNAPNGE